MQNNICLSAESVRLLCESDPILKDLIHLIGDVEHKSDVDYFESLAMSIIGQQLSSKAAATIRNRVQCLCSDKVTASSIISLSHDQLRAAGVSHAKIMYLKDLAEKVLTEQLDFSSIRDWDNEEVIKRLTEVKGIGKWTAEMFLIFALGRTNVMSYADAGLQRAAKWLYNLPEHPKSNYLQQVDHAWSPFQSVVSLYLWEAIDRGYVDSGKSLSDILDTN
ncbi:DNA-3-methyladenine glycosylase family protein [Paenibacillus sp. GYB003]|uniref:DNA-3-methyladenine glycosylase family protein n=1 Tax=Paenibacillus sp. GYB003 TaxID=2994392 RepID=UPI002F96456D